MNLNITKYVRRDIKHYIKLLFLCTVSLSNILASLHISYFFATNEINFVFTLTNGGNYTAVYLSLYPGIKVGTLAPVSVSVDRRSRLLSFFLVGRHCQ